MGLAVLAALAGVYIAWPKDDAQTPTTPASVDTVPNVPPNLGGVRFRWSAAPGIDLLSGVAVPVRAYYESFELQYLSNRRGTGYPGFTRAVPWPARKAIANAFDAHNPNPYEAYPPFPDTPMVGNVHYRIMSIIPSGDVYQTIVCVMSHYLYQQMGDGHYKLATPSGLLQPERVYHVQRIDLSDKRPVANVPPSPTSPQRGPQQAPVTDVFGRWQILKFYTISITASDPDAQPVDVAADDEVKHRCEAEMPLPADQRWGAYPLTRTTPPPTLPADPGWPALAG